MSKDQATYSLWLIPAPPAFKILTAVIRKLAVRFRTPEFEPHVTLTSGLTQALPELEQCAAILADRFGTFDLSCRSIDWTPEFFRSLFLPIKPTVELTNLYRDVHALVEVPQSSFFPHLSLLYGGLDPSVKSSLAEELAAQLPARIELPTLGVVHASSQTAVSTWRPIRTFPFRAEPAS